MIEQIQELLSSPVDGDGAPTLARLEDTLTEGYARALALEAELWRVERRLGELAREADGGDPAASAAEIAALSERLRAAEGELSRLRAALGVLYDRIREARALVNR